MVNPKGYTFTPSTDITVAELASIVATILNSQNALFQPEMFDMLHDQCKRHFTAQASVSPEAVMLRILASGG